MDIPVPINTHDGTHDKYVKLKYYGVECKDIYRIHVTRHI